MNDSGELFKMDIGSIRYWRTGIKLGAYIVYLLGGLFSAIIFSTHLASEFPGDPIMRFLAYGGAWANFLSLAIMPLAKEKFVSGRSMTVASWVFWVVEFLVVVLNVLAAYKSPWATWWTAVSPASPVMVILVWGVLFYLNPESKSHQEQVDFFINTEKDFRDKLQRAVKSQRVQDIMSEGATKAAIQFAERNLNVVLDETHDQPRVKTPNPAKKPFKEWTRAEKDAYYAKRKARSLQPPSRVQVSDNGHGDGDGPFLAGD